MLIDARHREETRVAVVNGSRIEEFDFESAERKQLKGNIYLAKVTRVEPSLQAAFIDYGGNRHGFLAFSEIHPDYYQIPKEDREALLREEAEHAEEEERLRAQGRTTTTPMTMTTRMTRTRTRRCRSTSMPRMATRTARTTMPPPRPRAAWSMAAATTTRSIRSARSG
jgi:Ribonuclease G/E